MSTKTITSSKSQTPVGTSGTKLYTATRTTYTLDSVGKVDPKSVKQEILYYEAPLSPGVIAATRTGTTGNWSFTNKPLSSNPWFGADAQKSLNEGALKTTTNQQIQDSAKKEGLTPEQTKTISSISNTANASLSESNPIVTGFNNETTAGLKSGITYKYPLKMDDTKQDYIRFEIYRLNRSTNQRFKENVASSLRKQVKYGREGEKQFYTRIGGPIILGIQGPIVDQNSMDWGTGQLNELQRMLAEESAQMMTSNKDPATAFSEGITEIMKKVSSNNTQFSGLLYTTLLEQAIGIPGLTSRISGGVLNPNMELLFQGPLLRPFNFTFKMSPREKAEADSVKAIINAFKRNMAPKVNNLFLQSPHVFEITYVHGSSNNPHKSLNLIKMCALQNCSVDYTPMGSYMTYNDGPGGDPEASMVSYTMNLTFSEITPVYQDDYDAESLHPIGF